MRTAIAIALLAAAALHAQAPSRCAAIPRDGILRTAGRYCLTGERRSMGVTGIEVAASGVTLDMTGGTLRSARTDPKSVGVTVRDSAAGAAIIGGTIDGFTTGIVRAAGDGLRVERVTLRNIGAIAIRTGGNRSTLSENIIEAVGGRPLDPSNAYAIGANLTGRNVVFSKNVIKNVTRQAMAPSVVGEAVGVLVGDECADCLVEGNTIAKISPERESIGIWNSGRGKVEIRANVITGFDQGIIALGRQFIVHTNQISCAGGSTTTGLLMSLGRQGDQQGEGSGFANRYKDCAIEQLICDNGCQAPWILETIQRMHPQKKPSAD